MLDKKEVPYFIVLFAVGLLFGVLYNDMSVSGGAAGSVEELSTISSRFQSLSMLPPDFSLMTGVQLEEQKLALSTQRSELSALVTTLDAQVLPLIMSRQQAEQAAIDSLQSEVLKYTSAVVSIDSQITTKTAELKTARLGTRLSLNGQVKDLQRQKKSAEKKQDSVSGELSAKMGELQTLRQELQRAAELQAQMKQRQSELARLETIIIRLTDEKGGERGGKHNPNLEIPAKGGAYCECTSTVYGKKTTFQHFNQRYKTKVPRGETEIRGDFKGLTDLKVVADKSMTDRIWYWETSYEHILKFELLGPYFLSISAQNSKEPFPFKTIYPPTPCTSHEQCLADCNAKLGKSLGKLSEALFDRATQDVEEHVQNLKRRGMIIERNKDPKATQIQSPPDIDEAFVGIDGVCLSEEDGGLLY